MKSRGCLAGDTVTELALEHASELLKMAATTREQLQAITFKISLAADFFMSRDAKSRLEHKVQGGEAKV
jgi:hypothetical protein